MKKNKLSVFKEMEKNVELLQSVKISDVSVGEAYLKRCAKSNEKIDRAMEHYADAYSSGYGYFVK